MAQSLFLRLFNLSLLAGTALSQHAAHAHHQGNILKPRQEPACVEDDFLSALSEYSTFATSFCSCVLSIPQISVYGTTTDVVTVTTTTPRTNLATATVVEPIATVTSTSTLVVPIGQRHDKRQANHNGLAHRHTVEAPAPTPAPMKLGLPRTHPISMLQSVVENPVSCNYSSIVSSGCSCLYLTTATTTLETTATSTDTLTAFVRTAVTANTTVTSGTTTEVVTQTLYSGIPPFSLSSASREGDFTTTVTITGPETTVTDVLSYPTTMITAGTTVTITNNSTANITSPAQGTSTSAPSSNATTSEASTSPNAATTSPPVSSSTTTVSLGSNSTSTIPESSTSPNAGTTTPPVSTSTTTVSLNSNSSSTIPLNTSTILTTPPFPTNPPQSRNGFSTTTVTTNGSVITETISVTSTPANASSTSVNSTSVNTTPYSWTIPPFPTNPPQSRNGFTTTFTTNGSVITETISATSTPANASSTNVTLTTTYESTMSTTIPCTDVYESTWVTTIASTYVIPTPYYSIPAPTTPSETVPPTSTITRAGSLGSLRAALFGRRWHGLVA